MKHSYNYYISFSYIILKPKANPSVQALGIVRFYSHERSEFTPIFNSIFISTLSNLNLERISNGKVKIEHIAKPVDIEESAVPGVEGGMQTDAEVAAKLGISENTVKTYVRSMLEKTGYRSRTELAVKTRVLGFALGRDENEN